MSLKTFTLISAIERSHFASVKSNFQMSCMEACGKNLYIGTDDGNIVHYSVEEREISSQLLSTRLECTKQGRAVLDVQKPVIQIEATTGLKRILALCDGTIHLINMLNMQLLPSFKIKLVNVFAINEKPARRDPFAVEMCVGTRKRSVQVYSIREDQCLMLREFQLDSIPTALKVNGSVMCVALSNEYKMISCDLGSQQDLFPFDPKQVRPIVVHISENEYLLGASNALGIFALSDGISTRPPLQWINNIVSVSYSHPYVIVLNDEFMTVHSILDQQQKQTIQFSSGIATSESNGRIFVATNHDVYCLVPEPIDRQIQSLLSERRIKEALELTKSIDEDAKVSPNVKEMMKRIELQAGFVEFGSLNFDSASSHFSNGDLDPRELISLYPGLLPESSKFTRSRPPLHCIDDILHLANDRSEVIERYEDFLFRYLGALLPRVGRELKTDVATAYLKMLGKLHPSRFLASLPKLLELVHMGSCIEYFRYHGNLHCAAALLCADGNADDAMDTWKRLCDGESKDVAFPGFGFVVESLSKLDNASLTWKHSDWLMEKDQHLAVKLFIKQSDELGPDRVVAYLKGFGEARISFLEHLLFDKKSQDEKYHTLLASLYLDEVLTQVKSKDEGALAEAREKLCSFLKSSQSYSVSALLPRVEGTDLHHELALLYGKLEDHSTALNILAEKVQNFEAAEDYCDVYSMGRPPAYRTKLFETLLSIYLKAKNFKEQYLVPTLALLSKHQNDFDAIKVIQAVPNGWSSRIISDFLMNSVRSSLHRCRTSKVQVMLTRGRNRSMRLASLSSAKDPVVMTEDRVCFLCNRPFTDPVFVSLPNRDLIAHVHCQQNLM